MTARQIGKKLAAAGIGDAGLAIGRDEVEVCVVDADGDCDREATRRKADRVRRALGWGGYSCGHGGWVVRADYTFAPEDYCRQP
jgi:hypothetical protein